MKKILSIFLLASLFIGVNTVFAATDPIYDSFEFCENSGGTVMGWDAENFEWVEAYSRMTRNICQFDDESVCEVVQFEDGICSKDQYTSFNLYSYVDPKPNLTVENVVLGHGGFLSENPTGQTTTILMTDDENTIPSQVFESHYDYDLNSAVWKSSDQADYYLDAFEVCNKGTSAFSGSAFLQYNGLSLFSVPTLEVGECSEVFAVAFMPVTDELVLHSFEIDTSEEELSTEDNIYSVNISSAGIELVEAYYYFDYRTGYYIDKNENEIDEKDLVVEEEVVENVDEEETEVVSDEEEVLDETDLDDDSEEVVEEEEEEDNNLFADIEPGYRFENAILYLKQNGIVKGYDDGNYRPENPINRAEFTKIIIESLFDEDEFDGYKDEACFDDVESNQWYTAYVCFAQSRGIVNGYENGTFKPGDNINFAEAQKIVFESYKENRGLLLPEKLEGDEWYSHYFNFSSSNNLSFVSELDANENINRAHAAEIIYFVEIFLSSL